MSLKSHDKARQSARSSCYMFCDSPTTTQICQYDYGQKVEIVIPVHVVTPLAYGATTSLRRSVEIIELIEDTIKQTIKRRHWSFDPQETDGSQA